MRLEFGDDPILLINKLYIDLMFDRKYVLTINELDRAKIAVFFFSITVMSR